MFRLFHAEFGGQISWLLPAALISLAAMAWVSRRAARTDRTRAAALLWGGWVLVTGLVFSYMRTGGFDKEVRTMFLVLRRFARSGSATMTMSSALTSARRVQPDH